MAVALYDDDANRYLMNHILIKYNDSDKSISFWEFIAKNYCSIFIESCFDGLVRTVKMKPCCSRSIYFQLTIHSFKDSFSETDFCSEDCGLKLNYDECTLYEMGQLYRAHYYLEHGVNPFILQNRPHSQECVKKKDPTKRSSNYTTKSNK
jgi:hypothetical protein